MFSFKKMSEFEKESVLTFRWDAYYNYDFFSATLIRKTQIWCHVCKLKISTMFNLYIISISKITLTHEANTQFFIEWYPSHLSVVIW